LDHIFILQKELDEQVALQKVPSSREDVFTSPLPLQEKRRLMKFLNYALNVENVGKSLSERKTNV
jgi:RAB protein geranylgeranyltransferase component A